MLTLTRAQSRKKFVDGAAGMRAARHHHRLAAVISARPDRSRGAVRFLLPGTICLRCGISDAGDRHVHHTEYRPVAFDQGDVDGEFAVTLNKLLGAVQRIYQPKPLPGSARLV